MVTSTALSADRARMQEVGLRHYLFKPIRRHDLSATISEVIGARDTDSTAKRSRDAPRSIIASPSNPDRCSILLADDSPDNRLIVKAFLQKTPFQIDEAENGERVVAKVKSNRYDLILMDIQMPILDGFAATRAIREWEQARRAASGADYGADRVRARRGRSARARGGLQPPRQQADQEEDLLDAIATLTSDAEPTQPLSMIAL